MPTRQWLADRGIWLPNSSVTASSSDKEQILGSRLVVGPNTFYYCKVNDDLNPGELVIHDHDEDEDTSPEVEHTAGTIEVVFTAPSDISKNQYADGYLHIRTGSTLGHMYRIAHNEAISNTDEGIVTLKDPIVEDFDSDTEMVITNSIFSVEKSASTQVGTPLGVPLCDVTDGDYAWICTYGPAPVILDATDGAAAADRVLTIGSTTAGRVEALDGTIDTVALDMGKPIVGQLLSLANATAGESELAMLTMLR